jgi:molecular chaperone GrpE
MIDRDDTERSQRAGEDRPAETLEEVGAPAGEPASTGSDARVGEAEDGARDAAQDAASDVERDLDELGEAKRERDEYLELAQRTKADFENYRKRVAKESAEAFARGKAELARELLPVIDNLERALDASPDDGDALAKGVALVLEELRAKLKGAGVEAYEPTGERFDPSLHEALSTQAREGTQSGVVLETLEKGYRLNGQVLRPARVVVSK